MKQSHHQESHTTASHSAQLHTAQSHTAQSQSTNSDSTQSSSPQPAYRPFMVRVKKILPLSPHFRRIIVTGEDLQCIGTDGYDQRIKVMLPLADGSWGDPDLFNANSVREGTWYEQWRALPAERRNIFRTYTIRAAHPDLNEVTIDFVIHTNPGPAGAFAERARIGDELVIIGPNAASEDSALGIDFHPGNSTHLLLAGDETAVPAIGSILDSLLRDDWLGSGTILLEVPEEADFVKLPHVNGLEINWVARKDAAHGSTLLERISTVSLPDINPSTGQKSVLPEVDVDTELLWEVPETSNEESENTNNHYAWIAGEAATVRDMRRILVRQRNLDRAHIAFMGYWRQGKAEG